VEQLQRRWEAARGLIEHEDNLSNHRLTWLLTLQGFLFAALTIGAGTLASGANYRYHGPVVFFLSFVVAAGVVSPLLLVRPLRSARRQVVAVRYWWENYGCKPDGEWAQLPEKHRYPPIIGAAINEFAYSDRGIPEDRVEVGVPLSSYWNLPKFLVVIWFLVLCVWLWLLIQYASTPREPASKVSISQDRAVDKVNIDFKP
jgi:hypothetical protein